MVDYIYIVVRLDGCLDAIAFDNSEAANEFLALHPEYDTWLESSIFKTCNEAQSIFEGV